MQRDITHVFLNPLEFGEAHTVNGRRVEIVLTQNAVGEMGNEQSFFNTASRGLHAPGLYKRVWTMYAPVSQMGEKPAVGSRLVVDDTRRFDVRSVEDDMGVYVLELEEMRS